MTNKIVAGECLECESSYYVEYVEQLVSQEIPEHCPFCGTRIEDVTEESMDDEDDEDMDLDDEDLSWE